MSFGQKFFAYFFKQDYQGTKIVELCHALLDLEKTKPWSLACQDMKKYQDGWTLSSEFFFDWFGILEDCLLFFQSKQYDLCYFKVNLIICFSLFKETLSFVLLLFQSKPYDLFYSYFVKNL